MVVIQVNKTYQARGDKMVAYLEKEKELSRLILIFTIEVVQRSMKSHANALA